MCAVLALLFSLPPVFLSLFSGFMAGYFLWKYFTLYLPNKAALDECVPSGGSCSIDGFANLETSGPFGLFFALVALTSLALAVWLFRRSATQ